MNNRRFPIKRIASDGVLAAVFFALTFLSIEIGGVKLTFDSLAVTVAAMLFGPVDGLVVGLTGAFLEQMVRYGFTATTLLWIIPPALRGLVIGLGTRIFSKKLSLSYIWNRRRPFVYLAVCIAAALATSVSNTLVYYVDAKMYGYYSYALIFGVFFLRLLTGVASALVTASLAIPIIKAVRFVLPEGDLSVRSARQDAGKQPGVPGSGAACDTNASKQALRAVIKEKKAALSTEEIESASASLAQKFLSHPSYLACKSVYVYMSYNSEVRTSAIIEAALASGRTVAIPKVRGREMRFYRIHSADDVTPGFKGILEPKDSCEEAEEKDALVLTPGLAFDSEGRRLGYGGGYYDRFLKREPHPTVALCYDFQFVDTVPANDLDVPVDFVLTADTGK